jgi:hypothetical protein
MERGETPRYQFARYLDPWVKANSIVPIGDPKTTLIWSLDKLPGFLESVIERTSASDGFLERIDTDLTRAAPHIRSPPHEN